MGWLDWYAENILLPFFQLALAVFLTVLAGGIIFVVMAGAYQLLTTFIGAS